MSVDTFIGLMGVIVPLINTSLICWLIWFSSSTARRNAEIAEQLRQQKRHERTEALKGEQWSRSSSSRSGSSSTR